MNTVGNLRISESFLGILEKFLLVLPSDLPHIISFLPPANEDAKVICLSTGGGVHAWWGGACVAGGACMGGEACMAEGIHGRRACMTRGVHGRVHALRGHA